MFRRIVWLATLVGIVYVLWRWRQQQAANLGPATAPQFSSRLPTNGGTLALRSSGDQSTATSDSTPRRIVTRVHRGAPPTAPLPSARARADDAAATAPEVSIIDAEMTAIEAEERADEAEGQSNSDSTLGAALPDAEGEAEPDAQSDQTTLVAPDAVAELEATLAVDATPAAGEPDQTTLVAPDAVAELEATLAVDATPAAGEPDQTTLVAPDAVASKLAEEVAPATDESFAPPAAPGLVNINSADADALIALPGIGPSLAKRIIDYREKNGPFARVEQLVDIAGIGYGNINEFRDLITV